jgi:hypothetical protein
MRYQAFLDLCLARARTMRFADPEMQHVDVAEIEAAAYNELLALCDEYDLDAFTVTRTVDDPIAVTSEGVTDYPLPGDFGRRITPKDDRETGIYLLTSSTAIPTTLRYRDPEDLYRKRVTTTGQPSWFTLSGNTLRLDPPPDDNSEANYTITGVYIRRVEPLDGDEPLLISHPTALIAATLYRLAADKGAAQAGALLTERTRAFVKLVNGQARIRQQFRPRHWTEPSMRGYTS